MWHSITDTISIVNTMPSWIRFKRAEQKEGAELGINMGNGCMKDLERWTICSVLLHWLYSIKLRLLLAQYLETETASAQGQIGLLDENKKAPTYQHAVPLTYCRSGGRSCSSHSRRPPCSRCFASETRGPGHAHPTRTTYAPGISGLDEEVESLRGEDPSHAHRIEAVQPTRGT